MRKDLNNYYLIARPWRDGWELSPATEFFDITAHLSASDEQVGFLWVGHTKAAIYAVGVEVGAGHQRQGIATAMYNWAEELSGKPVIPSSHAEEEVHEELLNADAQAFWAARSARLRPPR